jgi:tRNA(Ile)-lysidine synthase
MLLHPFERKIQQACRKLALMPQAGLIIVACSGGADSVALLLALAALCGRKGNAFPSVRLHTAHLDHGLRGMESAADAAFVADLCEQHGLPITIGMVSEEERSTWQGSLEASARTVRYRFLRAVAEAEGASAIALGHTLDDQAETVLLHLIRGTGLDGLTGMRSRSADLIRPILSLRRADTENYCAQRGIIPREDPSNADLQFTRNRIRHELLPLLETYQAQIRLTLARNADILAHDADYLNAAVDAAWESTLRISAPTMITLDRATLRGLHPALRSRIIRRAILAIGSPKAAPTLNADSITRLDRVILDNSGERRQVELATGAIAICHGNTVVICHAV